MSSVLQTLNENGKIAEWIARIIECRNSALSVSGWCHAHGICTQTFYRWQKSLFKMAKTQQEAQCPEVTPVSPARCGNVSMTARIAGAEADNHSATDADKSETALRMWKSCCPTSPILTRHPSSAVTQTFAA